MNPAQEARLKLGDLLMDPDATEAQVLAASAELKRIARLVDRARPTTEADQP